MLVWLGLFLSSVAHADLQRCLETGVQLTSGEIEPEQWHRECAELLDKAGLILSDKNSHELFWLQLRIVADLLYLANPMVLPGYIFFGMRLLDDFLRILNELGGVPDSIQCVVAYAKLAADTYLWELGYRNAPVSSTDLLLDVGQVNSVCPNSIFYG